MFSSFEGAKRDCFILKSATEMPAIKVLTVLVAQRMLWLHGGRLIGFRMMLDAVWNWQADSAAGCC